MPERRATVIFLVSAIAVLLVLCYVIARPFLSPLVSATVLAIVFFPAHARISNVIHSPSASALISTFLVTVVIIFPAIMIGAVVTRELTEMYQLVSHRSTESGGWSPYLMHFLERPLRWTGRYVDLSGYDLRGAVMGRLQQVISFLVAEAASVVGNITSFVVDSVITLFTLFFLFRGGRSFRRRAAAVLPLSREQVEKLFSGINNAIIGTVYGGLAVGAAQGVLTCLIFWLLGLPSPVVWGLAAALFSLVPLVGSGIVWVPASLILIVSGSWGKGLILLVYGIAVIGTIDNILRPLIISGHVEMHPLLLFFAVLGSVRAFGIIGLFMGPVVLAITQVVLALLREEMRAWRADTREPDSA